MLAGYSPIVHSVLFRLQVYSRALLSSAPTVQELLTSAQYVALLAPWCFLTKGWSLFATWRQGGWAAWQIQGHWRGKAG